MKDVEVAIQSIANPENTSYVVITREAERLVNDIHDHKLELRSSDELLADLQESGRSEVFEERKSNQKLQGNLGVSKHEGNYASPLIFTPRKASLFTRRSSPTSEKKWKVKHAHSPDGGHLAVSVAKMVTMMLRHFDQEERQTDGSRHWNSMEPVLMRACAHEGAQNFSDKKKLVTPDS